LIVILKILIVEEENVNVNDLDIPKDLKSSNLVYFKFDKITSDVEL